MGSSVNNNGDVEFEGGIDRFVIGSGTIYEEWRFDVWIELEARR